MRQGGVSGLTSRVDDYRQKVVAVEHSLPRLKDILAAPHGHDQWKKELSQAFAGSRCLLILDHMYGGGANAYREARAEACLKSGTAVLVATWDYFQGRLVLSGRLANPSRQYLLQTEDLSDLGNLWSFERIILNEVVLWAHLHEPIRHYRALPALLKEIVALKKKNNAFLEFDLHDYYAICPSFTLTDSEGRYCQIPDDPEHCRKCLQKTLHLSVRDVNLPEWRAAWQEFFGQVDEIRAFARTPLELLRRVFHIREDMCIVVPHAPLGEWHATYQPPAEVPMKVLVLGEIAAHKGAGIVRKLARLLKPAEQIVVLGSLEGKLPKNIVVHGHYDREELPELIRRYQPTIALVPSIWPETFCYTAQECELLGLPTVAFALGAQGERIGQYAKGLTATPLTAEAALESLRKLDEKRTSGKKNAPRGRAEE